MKYTIILIALLAFAFPQTLRPQEAATSKPPLPLVEESRRRAIEHLQAKRPDLKPDQLQLFDMRYRFIPASDRSAPFDVIIVAFLNPSSRTNIQFSGGGSSTTTRIIMVAFRSGDTESVEVTMDKSLTTNSP